MNLHEYQAKALFKEAGIPVPEGQVITDISQLDSALELISSHDCNNEGWVVKAQIHAGARGKAGGVKLVKDSAEAHKAVESMLGSFLATIQTAGKALPVHSVLIEQTLDIQKELYLSLLVDRETQQYSFVISASGGMDIETVAEETPEKILSLAIDPVVGVMPYQCREAGFALGLKSEAFKQLGLIMQKFYQLALAKDISQLEINPLVLTYDNKLIALDAKVNIDSNALYRQPDLVEMRDFTQEDEREVIASKHQLNYIALDGNIGCMVNGAGLAMATMDLIKLYGGDPANFLDVGGSATPERVAEAFKLILSSSDIKSILVNIFGGIVRCDLIAEGIIKAVQEVGLTLPVIVRLEGTNAVQGRELLANSGLSIVTAEGLTEAAKKVVAAAGSREIA